MTEEEKRKEMFKRYINSQQQKLDDYYRIDEEFYKDNIEELELNIKLLKQLNDELSKKDKVINLLYNLFYEYISIRPMSGIKFLNDKGFSKCKNCEKELEDENGISCKECIKEQFFKKAEEENE